MLHATPTETTPPLQVVQLWDPVPDPIFTIDFLENQMRSAPADWTPNYDAARGDATIPTKASVLQLVAKEVIKSYVATEEWDFEKNRVWVLYGKDGGVHVNPVTALNDGATQLWLHATNEARQEPAVELYEHPARGTLEVYNTMYDCNQDFESMNRANLQSLVPRLDNLAVLPVSPLSQKLIRMEQEGVYSVYLAKLRVFASSEDVSLTHLVSDIVVRRIDQEVQTVEEFIPEDLPKWRAFLQSLGEVYAPVENFEDVHGEWDAVLPQLDALFGVLSTRDADSYRAYVEDLKWQFMPTDMVRDTMEGWGAEKKALLRELVFAVQKLEPDVLDFLTTTRPDPQTLEKVLQQARALGEVSWRVMAAAPHLTWTGDELDADDGYETDVEDEDVEDADVEDADVEDADVSDVEDVSSSPPSLPSPPSPPRVRRGRTGRARRRLFDEEDEDEDGAEDVNPSMNPSMVRQLRM
jgi:hypothetical protein